MPDSVPNDYIVRVYDTRLEPRWLRDLAAEISPIDSDTVVIGGDFISKPDLEDVPAFRPPPLQRWCPRGLNTYHIMVPPRPHLASWLQRCHHQLGIEGPGALFSVCCIVPRAACPTILDAAAIQRLVPHSEALLKDPSVVMRVFAIGERPPIVKVPAEEMQLPPSSWEPGSLPRSQVLLVLMVAAL